MTHLIVQKISKIKSNKIILLGLLFLVIPFFNTNITSANTGINAQIPYSGTIVKNDGTVLEGSYRSKFILYNASSAGTVIYEEIRDGFTNYAGTGLSPLLSVSDGRFEILLGSQNTAITTVNDDSLWLELQLDMDNNGSYEEIFAPRKRIGSALSAINSMRLVANGGGSTNTLSLDSIGNMVFTGDSAIERMRITGSGNLTLTGGSITVSALGGTANSSTPVGFDRVLLANSSGQFNQVSLSSLTSGYLTTSTGWALTGNSTTDAWNGTSGTRLGTNSAQPLVLATTNATAQDIRFFTGNNGANERMRITGSGNIVIPILGGTVNGSAPEGYDRVLLANSSGQLSQVDISVLSGGGGSMLLTPKSTPENPTSGALVYSEPLAGRGLPFYITQSGRRKAIGDAWFGKQTPVQVGITGGSMAPVALGASVITSISGTSYAHSPISTNRYLSMPRKRYCTTNINSITGIRQDYTQFYSGNAPGYGGVFFSIRFGVVTNRSSSVFVGITSSTGNLVNASSLTNMIGMGYDFTDPTTGNWFLMKNNGEGTAQKIDLLATNAARGNDIGFELNLYNPPNSTDWYVYIVNLNTGAVVLNTLYTSDVEVPLVNTGLTWKAENRNSNIDPDLPAACMEHNYIYVEPQGW